MKTKLIKYLTLILLLAFVLSITCVSAFAYDDSFVGTWLLNEELTQSTADFNITVDFVYNNLSYESIVIADLGPPVKLLSFASEGLPSLSVYYFDTNYGVTKGYTASTAYGDIRELEILTEPDGEASQLAVFKAWLLANAVRVDTNADKNIYTTIYDLLKGGIYGNDYELTPTQEFALDIVCTWASMLCALAVPLAVVGLATRFIFGRRV